VSGTNRRVSVLDRRARWAKIFLHCASNFNKALYFNALDRNFEAIWGRPLQKRLAMLLSYSLT
jgi:hypothetical protein